MKIFVAILCLGFCLNSYSQSTPAGSLLEASVFAGSGGGGAVSWVRLHGFGSGKQRFKIGYGVRLSTYFGSTQNYITAPARLTSGKESIVALFTENIPANLDTVSFTKSQVNLLNAAIYLNYTPPILKDRLDVGMNIDALGFSFGGSQGGTYISNGKNAAVNAKPTGFNLLLISDSDRGSLNSEWFVRYWLSEKWAVKLGYEFLFTEYTTDKKVQTVGDLQNDRFRNKSSLFLLGVTWSLKR
jgi:hypothetical protein